MKIVSDAGPLIGLAKINCLYILKTIASEVYIPPMVYRELLGKASR
jgi:predicted nucleic acid-binding protein